MEKSTPLVFRGAEFFDDPLELRQVLRRQLQTHQRQHPHDQISRFHAYKGTKNRHKGVTLFLAFRKRYGY